MNLNKKKGGGCPSCQVEKEFMNYVYHMYEQEVWNWTTTQFSCFVKTDGSYLDIV